MKRPMVLIIRDGWGIGKDEHGNAVLAANTPVTDNLHSECPNTRLGASGEEVGLSAGSQGSSEVGHLNMGAGRIVDQEIIRINRKIEDGSFFNDPKLLDLIENCKKNRTKLHIMGLVQDQGVHAVDEHLYVLLDFAGQQNFQDVYVHLFSDGRDTPPRSALIYLERLEQKMASLKTGKIASVMGRYYAMDRDNNWERTKLAYDALTSGNGLTALSAKEAIEAAYDRADAAIKNGKNNEVLESDEFIKPTLIVDNSKKPVAIVEPGDSLLFFNYRQDRAVQLTKAFVEDDFNGFDRGPCMEIAFLGLTQYYDSFKYSLLKPMNMSNILGEVLSAHGIKQLRISETQKFRHVTSYFNSKREKPFPGEDRILVDSPKVPENEVPEMSAYKITDVLLKVITGGITASKNFMENMGDVNFYGGPALSSTKNCTEDAYDLIIVNYVNGDMVGHTGSFDATKKAIEVVDECVGKVVKEIIEKDGVALITADHGNAEQMIDPSTGKVQTAHTLNDVEFFYVDKDSQQVKLRERGRLSDIAPTILGLMEIDQPDEMTAESLINKI